MMNQSCTWNVLFLTKPTLTVLHGVKCFLFKAYCFNLSCAPMWFDCTKVALKKLKIAYNNSLRRFMFLPWRHSATEMFANLGIHSFDEMLRIFVFRFCSRVTESHNQLIFGLCSAHTYTYIHIQIVCVCVYGGGGGSGVRGEIWG